MPRNFGKGLKPFSKFLNPSCKTNLCLTFGLVQRLFESDDKKENQNDNSLLKPGDEWLIDDEEDYPMSYAKSIAT